MGYKLKRILIYPDGVTEKQVYPAGWKPGANTIVYYPLNSDKTVYNLGTLGSNYDLTNNGVTFSSEGGYFNGSSWLSTSTNLPDASQYTIAFWVKPEKQSQFAPIMQDGDTTASNDFWIECDLDNGIGIRCKSDSGWTYKKPSNWNNNSRYCVILTMSSSGKGWYVNNVSLGTGSGASNVNTNYHHQLQIGRANDGNETRGPFKGYIGHIVIDTSIWNENERLNYYNLTKSNYGL